MLPIVLDWTFPKRCALCSRLDDRPVCPTCASEIVVLEGLTQESLGSVELRSISCYPYSGRAALAVRRLKYERVLTHAPWMSERLLQRADREGWLDADAFVPVPIHWSRRCERGFNQAEVLCESLPNVQSRWLSRVRRTRQQVGLSPERRRHNLKGAFRASPDVRGAWIVLVDDVITSGGTAAECSRSLHDAGALRVDVLTFCSGGAIDEP